MDQFSLMDRLELERPSLFRDLVSWSKEKNI